MTFDEHFGNNPQLLDRVDTVGLLYLAEVPHDARVWLTRPRTEVPPAKGKGRPTTREQLCEGEPDPVRVDRLAEQLPNGKWVRYEIKRAVAVRNGLPGPELWVVLRRSLGEKPELKAYLSNAPAATPYSEFVRVSGMRWPVETAIEESKGELGMDHYQVRGWTGWHHHMTMTFLSHHFLVRLRIQLGGGESPALTVPQVRLLLNAVLPRKRLDPETAIDLIYRTQHQNYAAYCSHRRHTLRRLDSS